MKPETYPWLKWPGADRNRIIQLNNQLALLQHKKVVPPRFLDWELMNKLKVMTVLESYFSTRVTYDANTFTLPIWRNAFEVREPAYREWCLEFYASIELAEFPGNPNDWYAAKVVKFRLGGQEHRVTVQKFGQLIGLYSEEELAERGMSHYASHGSWSYEDIHADRDNIWMGLSGRPHYKTTSKAVDLNDPMLRLLQKALCHSINHRATHQDKVYKEDLWMLSYFAKRTPTEYVYLPMAIVKYLSEQGKGRKNSSGMLCGHFITRMVKNLGFDTTASRRGLSKAVDWKLINKGDLKLGHAMNRAGKFAKPGDWDSDVEQDSEEEEESDHEGDAPEPSAQGGFIAGTSSQGPVPQGPTSGGHTSPPLGPFDFNPMMHEMYRIGRQVDATREDMSHLRSDFHQYGDYTQYHMERYQPMWEYMTTSQYHVHHPEAASGWTEYNPPPMWNQPPPNDEE